MIFLPLPQGERKREQSRRQLKITRHLVKLHATPSNGLKAAREGFADRAYRDDGTLVPRSEPGAVIHDPTDVLARVVPMARRFDIDTICVHGDTPGAAQLALRIRAALEAAHLHVRSL